jgi:hypothetical protein
MIGEDPTGTAPMPPNPEIKPGGQRHRAYHYAFAAAC